LGKNARLYSKIKQKGLDVWLKGWVAHLAITRSRVQTPVLKRGGKKLILEDINYRSY
jgi:hypothetical protein